jgi:hypothetical protein
MKFQTMMVIKAIVCLVLGVPILLAPTLLYAIFGLSLNPAGAFAAREYGAAMIGILMVCWFGGYAPESPIRWAIALGLCAYDAIGFVISAIAVLAGTLNSLGWAVVLLYLLLALGFGYFLVKRPLPAVQRGAA